MLHRNRDETLAIIAPRNIGDDGQVFPAERRVERGEAIFSSCREHELRAARRQHFRKRLADAGAGAGDDNHHPIHFSQHASTGCNS